MTPHYFYHMPHLNDYGKNFSLDDQDFELSVAALKVLVHPCFKFIDLDNLEYLIDKL